MCLNGTVGRLEPLPQILDLANKRYRLWLTPQAGMLPFGLVQLQISCLARILPDARQALLRSGSCGFFVKVLQKTHQLRDERNDSRRWGCIVPVEVSVVLVEMEGRHRDPDAALPLLLLRRPRPSVRYKLSLALELRRAFARRAEGPTPGELGCPSSDAQPPRRPVRCYVVCGGLFSRA